jgi:hypothetical protein
VKDIVQGWASGQSAYGFMLRGASESSTAPMYDRGYDASEGDHPPVLRVTYVEGGGGPDPTVSPTTDPSPTVAPDTTPPTVVDVQPPDGAENVAPNAQIKVTFSEPVTGASLVLEDLLEDERVPGQTRMSADRRVLTFTPGRSLDSWYWVTVSGARDDAGNTMIGSYEWWFGTWSLSSMRQTQARSLASAEARMGGPAVSAAWTHARKSDDGGAIVPTLTPEFMVKAADHGQMRPAVEVEVEHDPQAPSQGKGLIWSGGGNSGTGLVGLVRMPDGKLADGWKARWRARAVSAGVAGEWSDWQTFTVDSTGAPPSPRVSSERSMSVQAAEPAFSYDRIENARQCRELNAFVKNSYNWCMWGVISSKTEYVQNRKVIGWVKYKASFALIGHSLTGEKKTSRARLANNYDSRQFKVYFHISDVERDGGSDIRALEPEVKAAAQVFPFSLGFSFNQSSKCTVAPTGLNGFIYKSPEKWAQEGGNFTFTSDATRFPGPDHIGRCKLRPQIHMTEQLEDAYAYLSDDYSPVLRCDSSPDIKTSKGGCVVWKAGRPIFELSRAAQVRGPGNQMMTNPVRESAQHIWDAWNNPAATEPKAPGKKIPGFTWSNALQRNTDTSRKGLGGMNRKKAIEQCDRSFSDPPPRPPGKRYTRNLKNAQGQTIYRSCDEFPFAATHQGAHNAGTNFSARAILASDNSTSGSWLGWWFERNRVLEKQKFTVRISNSQQAGVNGYYPPPPDTDTLADEQIVPDSQAP